MICVASDTHQTILTDTIGSECQFTVKTSNAVKLQKTKSIHFTNIRLPMNNQTKQKGLYNYHRSKSERSPSALWALRFLSHFRTTSAISSREPRFMKPGETTTLYDRLRTVRTCTAFSTNFRGATAICQIAFEKPSF